MSQHQVMSPHQASQNRPVTEGSRGRKALARAVTGAIVCSISLVGAANATPVLITNPSFEVPVTSTFSVGTPTGWLPFPAAGGSNAYFVVNEAGRYPAGADDGDQAAQITLFTTNPSVTGVLFQALTETLLPDQKYTLSVALAVSTGDAANGFSNGGALIELFADSGATFLTGVTTPAVSTDGLFTTFTATYTSPSAGPAIGSTLLIRLQANGNGVNQTSLAFDNVQLTAVPVPEPSTMLMASLGAASVGLIRWRRRRAATNKS